jgi:hypothetical protein
MITFKQNEDGKLYVRFEELECGETFIPNTGESIYMKINLIHSEDDDKINVINLANGGQFYFDPDTGVSPVAIIAEWDWKCML